MSTMIATRPRDRHRATARVARRPGGATSLRETLSQTMAMAWRATKKMRRNPEQFFDVALQPLLFTAMFAYIFGGAISGDVESYLPLMIPGILAQTALTACMATGVAAARGHGEGRLRPVQVAADRPDRAAGRPDGRRPAALRDRGDADLRHGIVMGYRPGGGVAGVLAAILLAIIAGWSLAWVFTWVGTIARSAQAVQGISMMIMFPLTFLSNAFVPVETLPELAGRVREGQPGLHLVTAVPRPGQRRPVTGEVGWALVGVRWSSSRSSRRCRYAATARVAAPVSDRSAGPDLLHQTPRLVEQVGAAPSPYSARRPRAPGRAPARRTAIRSQAMWACCALYANRSASTSSRTASRGAWLPQQPPGAEREEHRARRPGSPGGVVRGRARRSACRTRRTAPRRPGLPAGGVVRVRRQGRASPYDHPRLEPVRRPPREAQSRSPRTAGGKPPARRPTSPRARASSAAHGEDDAAPPNAGSVVLLASSSREPAVGGVESPSASAPRPAARGAGSRRRWRRAGSAPGWRSGRVATSRRCRRAA